VRKLLPPLLLLVLLAGCALSGPTLLADTETVELERLGSCGLRTATVEYRGDVYRFELAYEDDVEVPDSWWGPGGSIELLVGTFKGQVWAVGPDDSLWRLVRHGEAALWFCLW
jgi:hypothetical protein